MNGHLEEAITVSEQAIAHDPELVEAHWNFSQILLLSGDFKRGFVEYEWRWQRPETPPPGFPQPVWDGAPLAGRTILLHAEQGLGDAIQFARYAPLVAQRGGRVLLQCHPGLVWLLRGIHGVSEACAFDAQRPEFDCHAPLMSLPRIFSTTLDSIPDTVPYLRPVAGRETGTVKRIGLCWQGSPSHRMDRRRSLFAAAFAPLAQLPGVRLVSLQKDHGEEQLSRLPAGLVIEPLGDDFDAGPDAFRDTVSALSDLDLVISADTAVAHLAGALGHPVWILLAEPPDWRWLRQRADSPWYPTARLFRQASPGEWDSVISDVKSALQVEFGNQ